MKAQHSTTNRPVVEPAPSITASAMRHGDSAEVCIGIAYGYLPLVPEMDLKQSHGLSAVIALGRYAGYIPTGTRMTKGEYRSLERAARGFLIAAQNPDNKRLTGFVLRHALARALASGVVGKRSRRS